MSLERLLFPAHLRARDNRLFDAAGKNGAAWDDYITRASEDVEQDLKAMGYLPPERYEVFDHELLDEFASASVTLTFAATDDGSLVVPAGTVVANISETHPGYDGAVKFTTDEELTVAAGETGTVAASAENPGRVYNAPKGQLTFCEGEDDLENFSYVTNAVAAAGGKDHQLTQLATYRALIHAYMDFIEVADDVFDYKRQLNAEMYHDELRRRKAAGIAHDLDQDGDEDSEEYRQGFVMLERS